MSSWNIPTIYPDYLTRVMTWEPKDHLFDHMIMLYDAQLWKYVDSEGETKFEM